MDYQRDRSWLEVDLDVIERNYLNIAEKLEGACRIMAVLKADAYGLGALPVARLLERTGCSAFAVATLEEAMELRDGGVAAPLLILGPINPEHTASAIRNGFWLTLVDGRQAEKISDAAQACGKKVSAHIKIDSGLSRLGIVIKNRFAGAVDEMKGILSLPGLEVVGAFTHTSGFNGPDAHALEREELALFAEAVTALRATNPHLKAHCLSSSTLLDFPEYRYDFVRVGILCMGSDPDYSSRFGVSQAVGLKTRIVQVKLLDTGTPVSYGATFVTSRPTKTALVPIGYADGLRRSLSNRGAMIVHGKKAPIIGKICCDYSILDVTDIPEAREGDVVTVFGRDGGEAQYPYDYANLYPASVSEVTATLTSRIPRFYLQKGQPSAQMTGKNTTSRRI